MDHTGTLVALAYGSLLVELLLFPVPSEASTLQLFTAEGGAGRLATARARTVASKVVGYLLPTALGVALFLVPPLVILEPRLLDALGRVGGLEHPAVAWTGAGLVLLGRGITFSSMLQLRATRRRGDVQARGWFGLCRNPGLLGMYLFYAGNVLVFPCAVLLAGFAPYVWNMHRRVRLEESHLLHLGGATYREYLERVPRYLPLGGGSRAAQEELRP